jgi:hypothetical protein
MEMLHSLLFISGKLCYSSGLVCCSLFCMISLQTLMSAKKEVLIDVTSHKFARISLVLTGVSAILVTNQELLGNAVWVRVYRSFSIQVI